MAKPIRCLSPPAFAVSVLRGITIRLESSTGSGVFAVRSARQTRFILINGQPTMMTCLHRPPHTPYKRPVGCVSRSHRNEDFVTSLKFSSLTNGSYPSSRSRTHQNQAQLDGREE